MASTSPKPDIKDPGALDRTLKADDLELMNAVRDERLEARVPKVERTQNILERAKTLLSNSKTLISAVEGESNTSISKTNVDGTNISKGSLTNPLETVIRYVHNELIPDKPDSSSSLLLSHDGRVTDSMPDINLTPPDMSSLPKLSDNYEIIKRFAKGGQGVLAKARDKMLRRIVAVKSLRSEHLNKEDIRRAFIEEALITAQLDHPAIISIYSLLRDDKNGIHLSMKLLRGKTLNEYLENVQDNYVKGVTSQISFNARIKENLGIFVKICEALAYAHSRHIIHCDLKPDNVMLGEYGEVFVMDWGLAKKLDARRDIQQIDCAIPLVSIKEEEGSFELVVKRDPDVDLLLETNKQVMLNGMTGTVSSIANESFSIRLPADTTVSTSLLDVNAGDRVNLHIDIGTNSPNAKPKLDGTPRFIPPEAYAGVPRDERADIFALGLILFEMVTLRRGYDGHSIKEVIHQVRAGERNPVAHRFGFRIDKDLIAIIDKATAYDPTDRYQTVQELIADVQRLMNDDETDARPDNYFRFLARYLRRHSKMVIMLALAGWISALLVSLETLRAQEKQVEASLRESQKNVDLLKKQAEEQRYQELVSQIEDQTNNNASRLSGKLVAFTNALSNIAMQAGSYLDVKEAVNYPGSLPIYPSEEVTDRGSVYSTIFNREIGMDFCTYQQPEIQSRENTEEIIRRMRPVAKQLQQLVLYSNFPLLTPPVNVDNEELRARCADDGMPVFQDYIALEDSHIQICFPGHNAYTSDYDNHDRIWYQEAKARAKKNLRDPHWTLPYMDNTTGCYVLNCTVPIVSQYGNFLGACSFKMRVSSMKEMILGNAATHEYVLERWMLTQNGRVLFHQKENDLVLTDSYATEALTHIPPSIQTIAADIFNQGDTTYYGSKEFLENGYQVTYHYAYIERLNVYLLTKTSKARLLKQLTNNSRFRRDEKFRGLPPGH